MITKMHREIDGSEKREAFTKETTRQLAMFKALREGPPGKIYQKIADNLCSMEEMQTFINDGFSQEDIHLFSETLPLI